MSSSDFPLLSPAQVEALGGTMPPFRAWVVVAYWNLGTDPHWKFFGDEKWTSKEDAQMAARRLTGAWTHRHVLKVEIG